MTVWFISRHPGARAWAERHGVPVDEHVVHLDAMCVVRGDTVIGTLPVNLAAAVCARGARFINLSIDLPADARGRELSAEDLERFNARLEEFHIERVERNGAPASAAGERR